MSERPIPDIGHTNGCGCDPCKDHDARMTKMGFTPVGEKPITDDELTTWYEDVVLFPAIASSQRSRAIEVMMACVPRLIAEIRRLREPFTAEELNAKHGVPMTEAGLIKWAGKTVESVLMVPHLRDAIASVLESRRLLIIEIRRLREELANARSS